MTQQRQPLQNTCQQMPHSHRLGLKLLWTLRNSIAALVTQYFGQRLAPQKTRVTKLFIRFWVLFTAHCSKNTTLEYIWIQNNSAFLDTKDDCQAPQRNSINASSTELISRLIWLSKATLTPAAVSEFQLFPSSTLFKRKHCFLSILMVFIHLSLI